ncbi:hypothetical protein ARALYDRAFT_489833 [Arabidopsis lyrata subsp. lyrata]|uniref:Sugar phosphate transporter domain-containing protein n=1 Tax=Arabidopsis lyrata subsp. lyrata TaxID=81972 RepID=D7LXD4_ARALL|nr:hypothetical protein ARALYDRAFT_489833 [Arabidopsis lyrata subsp. lyrata]
MAPVKKSDKKATLDAAAWIFNVVTSVGIIIVNKALIYGFSFATTLTGLHFATKTLMTLVLRCLGYIQPSHLPFTDLLKFILFANFSIVGMNVSRMWNSVGFYKYDSRVMLVGSCIYLIRFVTREIQNLALDLFLLVLVFVLLLTLVLTPKVSLLLLLLCGVLLCNNIFHQRKYSLSSFNLLGHTAPAQAATLLIVGPFLDYWLTDKRVDMYDYNFVSLMFITLLCTIAIGTILSQFICIGRFTAVSFQVLGHMKTILVLVMGFFFFDRDGLNLHVVLGMIIAVLGMIWYGNASSKPGGKEKKNYSLPTTRQQKQGAASDSDEYQGKA